MSDKRPAIPEPMKREVRQQCFFGCAICGMPFFQYDHVVEYSEIKEHTADNLVLLCPNHHAMKTAGKLDKEIVSAAKKNPFNSTRETTSSLKIEGAKEVDVIIGSSKYKGVFSGEGSENFRAIVIDNHDFLTIHNENGILSISVNLTDEHAKSILKVDRGELKVWTDTWDFDYPRTDVIVRKNLGDILLNMKLSSSEIHITKGSFYIGKGAGISIENKCISVINNGIEISRIMDASFSGGDDSIGFYYEINNRSLPDWVYE
ncbi:TPA: HNH endonuclease [Klebsiella aerogenes]